MKYLTRNKIYERVESFKNAKKIYIFCEGENREITYFNYFQGFTSNIDIIPIPNENGKSDPTKLKQNAELLFDGNKEIVPIYKLSKEYEDQVWFVIDTDKWNENDKINILRKFVSNKNDSYNGWFVAQSNPSFEIWLYYHFYKNKPNNNEVIKYKSFKEFLNSKIIGGFDNRSMPLKIYDAIINAKKNFEVVDEQPYIYSTEVYKLGEEILKFTEIQIKDCLLNLKK